MIVIAECQDLAKCMAPYVERALPAEECAAMDAHLRSCSACREAVQRYRNVRSVLQGALGAGMLSPDFAETTGKRLRAVTPEARPPKIALPAPPAPSLAGALQKRLGAVPWWMLSGAFHALLLLLLTLIGMAIYRAQKEDVVIMTNLEQKKEPEKIKKPLKRDVFKKPEINATEITDVQTPVVMHEEVEVADEVETPDESDAQEAVGDEGLSDVPLGGVGSVAALGLGGGGGGAFGRPTGAGGRLRRAIRGGGSRATESAVDAALEWLARHQEADGHWDDAKHGGGGNDTAVTGYALLAFLGAGHTEKIGKYKDNVRRAIDWLKGQQNKNGYFRGKRSYPHGIVSIALSEAAGMAHNPETTACAQKAIDYATEIHQNGEGSEQEGFGYGPKSGRTDLSVSGWFIMALKSARTAGLKVDTQAIDGAVNALDHVQEKIGEKDGYPIFKYWYSGPKKKFPLIQGKGNHTNHRLCAIGCLCRMFLGWMPDKLEPSVHSFIQEGGNPKWSADGSSVDLYYWYYGTLCTFQLGGDTWKSWNEAMKKALLPHQVRGGKEDGSWDVVGTLSSSWGRVGQTALAILCLEVYYRYLPLYR